MFLFRRSLVVVWMASSLARAHQHQEQRPQDDHWQLELVDNHGDRQLFPLMPGVPCPSGHTCHAMNRQIKLSQSSSLGPTATTRFVSSVRGSMKTHLQATLDWKHLGDAMETVVVSDNVCTRRRALNQATAALAGLTLSAAAADAAETKEVKMGADNGGLQFVPSKTTICKGDTVKWINNKGGPHNVVFDEDAIPAGVDQAAISMEEQLGEEGESFSMTFSTVGNYEYYCEPHRGAGMNGALSVTS